MKAPNFSLKDQNGKTHTLGEYKGKWLVLYFYPKDDTPGCKIEACGFRDEHKLIKKEDAEVVGISKDSTDSHKEFDEKYGLGFTLLSDSDLKVSKEYGAWGKKMFGREGVLRKTFIIGPDGEILKAYDRVGAVGHASQVMTDLRVLKQVV